jgi:hypothetical protein
MLRVVIYACRLHPEKEHVPGRGGGDDLGDDVFFICRRACGRALVVVGSLPPWGGAAVREGSCCGVL